ncbi:ParB/RepB/Spo0J family partition protein, partial [Roseovarius atlanticus]
MAKRKRLTPATHAHYLDRGEAAPETKAMYPQRAAPTSSFNSAPIADVARQNAASAALEEMADTLQAARENGRMVLDLPLEAVDETYLVRDRTRVDADEMATLRASIVARGQQTPIEVVSLEGGRYGLISGWRRLAALRQLATEYEGKFDTIQALLRRPDDSANAYLAMVEENEVRVGLSYYERARIAARSVEHGVFETHKAALLSLFRSASRTKRSKIRS